MKIWRPKDWKIPIIGCNEGANETCYENGYEDGADAMFQAIYKKLAADYFEESHPNQDKMWILDRLTQLEKNEEGD